MTRDFLLILVSMFVWGMGEGMFTYFQPLYLQQWGASPVMIGGILGTVGLAITAVQAPAGYLGDRIGTRPLLWASWALATGFVWMMALASSLPVFATALVFYGLTAAMVAPINSYITGIRGHVSIGRALALTYGAWQLGSVFGPLVGGKVGEESGMRSIYFIAAGILTVSTAVVLFIRPLPIHPEVPAPGKSQILRNPHFMLFIGIMAAAVFATYLPYPFTSNFLQNQRGLSLAAIGQLGALSSLGSALLALTLAHLNPSLVLLIGQACVGVFALLLWRGTGMAWYGLGAFFFGGYRLSRSMTSALARRLIPAGEIGLAYGLMETANSSATILAPIAAGFLYQQNPILIYPASLAAIGIALAASGWYLAASRHSPARKPEPVEIEFAEFR